MIGLFDTGNGGLTVLKALRERFPDVAFTYLGDHANAPYGNRPADDVLALTEASTEKLFGLGCRLVILACNTATAVACREMQQNWLPNSRYAGTHNVLGIVAPTVEAATQTPWAVQTPQYPQRYNRDLIAIFGTRRTISSNVYPEEIRKRCPDARVVQQACPRLAGAIEDGADEATLGPMVSEYVSDLLAQTDGEVPDRAILGCTHYPLAERHFQAALPSRTRLLAQPDAVAHSLEDYLTRHPHYAPRDVQPAALRLVTTGCPQQIAGALGHLMPDMTDFQPLES